MSVVYAGLVALGAVAAWLAMVRRGLRQARDGAAATWIAIDELLRRRHDLTAQLLATVQREVPESGDAVATACTALDRAIAADDTPVQRTESERRLVGALALVAALAEDHPRLGACGEFVEQQAQLADLEEQLIAARRIYNADVRLYRTRLHRAPIRLLGEPFPERAYFELDHTREALTPPWGRMALQRPTA